MNAFRFSVRLTVLACLLGGLLLGVGSPARAVYSVESKADDKNSTSNLLDYPCTITVTNANDSGAGSLRQAVIDLCVGGLINFNLSYPALITLTSEILLNKAITINGPGESNLTVSGGNATRVFNVMDTTVSISNLTIANGVSPQNSFGAGIYNWNSTLAVSNITFLENNAPLNSGGGIYNHVGTVTIVDSTFSNNAAHFGGGIYNNGNLTVSNSNFSGNNVSGSGGGIYNPQGQTITVVNSTFSNSTAVSSGGGIYSYGVLTVADSTFHNNYANYGGGIANNTVLTQVFRLNSERFPGFRKPALMQVRRTG